MLLHWMSWRFTSLKRSLLIILFIAVLAISLNTFYAPHPFYPKGLPAGKPFEINFDFDFEPIKSQWRTPKSQPEQASSPTGSLGAHTVNPDGLLVVNPDAPHPIFQLMRDAEAAWEAKNARASKTLGEAVAEYKRRYQRPPPRGFDKWWEYVVKHDIQLPDEYDEIFEDIEPFMGLDPKSLARTQQDLEKKDQVVTFEKTDGDPELKIVRSTLKRELPGTITDVLDLIRDFEQDLPPLRFSMAGSDNPDMVTDWRIKDMLRKAAAKKKTYTNFDLPIISKAGWIQACPPDSPARTTPNVSLSPPNSPPPPPTYPKTFIASHREAMDPCLHPWLLSTHGQFISHLEGPYAQKTLVPRFSLCASLLHHDIRPPVPYGWDWYAEEESGAYIEDLPWESKTEDRLNWRGRTTGMYAKPKSEWKRAHRMRLITLTNTFEGNVSVLDVPENGNTAVGDPTDLSLSQINPDWMDVAFAYEPISCDRSAGTCDEMLELLTFEKVHGKQQEGRQKFILDIDGNGWSGRFKRLITSNALIFKATIYPEWYTSRIAPWVHYVPIQVSFTDLYDAVAFFRVHDELAAKIAKGGREWSRRYWRREDMAAYMYRLLLEYARASALNRPSMDYTG